MTELVPIECEARLVGLSKQRRKDGDWIEVKFHIHPDDHPAALFILPLGTHCMLSVKGTPEERKEAEKAEKPKGGPICRRAVLLCKRQDFRRWLLGFSSLHNDAERVAKEELCRRCHIESRTELDHNDIAAATFEVIENDFHASQRGQDTDQLQTARDAGYR